MTRHTLDLLRTRNSNMSLRSLPFVQSSSNLSLQPETAEAEKQYVEAKDVKPEDFTKPYCDFMTANPTVFHATAYFKESYEKAGFVVVRTGM